MNRYSSKMRKRKKFKIKSFFFTLLIVVILPSLTYFGFISYKTYTAAGKTYTELDRGKHSDLRAEEVIINKDPISILLIGLENYTSDFKGGRTDSLMVATFNPVLKTMKLTSIPRDTYVFIDAKGRKDKITHAYGVGGRDETIKTVETLLNIPIDYYVQVNFNGFKDIIDEIGGVTVDVPFDFHEYTDTHPRKRINFTKGKSTLNGEEALAYARMRKSDPRGDFGRNDRQKELIKSIIDKISTPTNLLKIDDISEHLGENVTTNVKMSDPIFFLKKYNGFSSNNIETLNIEGADTYIDDVYYFVPNEHTLLEVQTQLQSHLEYTNQYVNENKLETKEKQE